MTLQTQTRPWWKSRFGPAVMSGLLLALAFPPVQAAGLAWIAPGVLLLTTLGAGPAQSFRLGYVAGLTHCLASLYWLWHIPVHFFPILGWLALSGYLALFYGLWAWTANLLLPGGAIREEGWRSAVRQLAGRGLLTRVLWTMGSAVVWTALEMARGCLLTGFPWNNLGASQLDLTALIQIVSITGVPGLTFLVCWGSTVLMVALAVHVVYAEQRKLWLGDLLPLGLGLCLVWTWGAARVFREMACPPADELRVVMIQPSIPQTLIWDEQGNSNRFARLLQFSELALRTRPQVLLWPESAVPEAIRFHEPTYVAITNLAMKYGVWIILCSDDAEPRAHSGQAKNEMEYYNCSFLVSPEGRLMERYIKRQLVMFGEYVPWSDWLPFLKWFTPIGIGFTPGKQTVSFNIPMTFGDLPKTASPRRVKVLPLICFEDIFPALTRAGTDLDTDFLLNLTNDGWFGQSAAQWQHARSAAFRAVELHRPLVRCANNGLTCWVDSLGRMHEVTPEDLAYQFGETFKATRIPLISPADRRMTFYHRFGDWFGWSCVILGLGLTGFMLLRQSGNTTKNKPAR